MKCFQSLRMFDNFHVRFLNLICFFHIFSFLSYFRIYIEQPNRNSTNHVIEWCEENSISRENSIADRKLNSDDFVIIVVVIIETFACILHDAFYWFFSCHSRQFLRSALISSSLWRRKKKTSSCSCFLFHMQKLRRAASEESKLSFSQRWCINCGVGNLNIYKCNSSSEEEFGWAGEKCEEGK